MTQLRSTNRTLALLAGGLLLSAALSASAQVGGGGFGTAAGGASTRTYTSNTQVGEAIITSDPETRSLVIVTDAETNENIKRVIQSLDRPKPQVLINVVFLQVTHNNDLDFGIEGSYTHDSGNGRQGTTGTDLGIAAIGGGGFYQIISDDVTLLIRALAVSGKTEILSRPSILARNNQQATISVGQRIPIITGTVVTDNGTPVSTYQYQNVGIILRVTPFINSDNTVEMIVSPEISALSDTRVDIGTDTPVQAIDNRSADTVVVVESGKTVVIGGLIANQKIERDTKVPFLGDIPLLGYAFKRTEKKNTKTELLIMITPTVMQRPGELARVSIKETQKLQLAPEVFKREQLERFVEGYGEEAVATPDPESESLQDLRQRALEYLQQQENSAEPQPGQP